MMLDLKYVPGAVMHPSTSQSSVHADSSHSSARLSFTLISHHHQLWTPLGGEGYLTGSQGRRPSITLNLQVHLRKENIHAEKSRLAACEGSC